MTWLKLTLTYFMAALMMWTPMFSHAGYSSLQKTEDMSADDYSLLQKTQDNYKNLGFELKLDPTNKRALLFDTKNNNKSPVMEIPYGEDTELKKFSPNSFNKELLKGLANAKAGETFQQTIKRLPWEAFIFSVAIGSVIAGQLVTDYSANPLAMQQHIQQQLSPFGIFSFFVFMYSQGVASNILSTWLATPKFREFIPYMGMSVGFFMQSSLGIMAGDPNVRACALGVAAKVGVKSEAVEGADQKDPCGEAFNFYVMKKRVWDLAPSLVSMISSTYLAGQTQKLATKAIIRITGVDIGLAVIPGAGWGVQFVRFVVIPVAQMALFYYLDAGFLNRPMTQAWKNIWDGRDFNSLNNEVVNNIVLKKKTNWQDQLGSQTCTSQKRTHDCDRDFAFVISEFGEKMRDWRMFNLMEVYEGHQNWQDSLEQLNKLYNVSYSFYRDYVSEVRNSNFDLSPLKRLDIPMPLNGVTAKDLAENKQYLNYLNPNFTANMQMATVQSVGSEIIRKIKTGEYKKQEMEDSEIKILNEAATLMISTDLTKQGQGLQKITNLYLQAKYIVNSDAIFWLEIPKIYKALGAPHPTPEPGRGFLYNFELYSDVTSEISNVTFPKVTGNFKTEHLTEYLVLQMICGPDVSKNESIIKQTKGFSATFLPPSILKNTHPDFDFCDNGLHAYEKMGKEMFSIELKNEQQQKFTGVIDYIKKNSSPSVIGTKDQDGFMGWWESKIQEQMKSAYEKYAAEYDKLVIKLIRTLFNKQKNSLNLGSIENGTLLSMQQESKVYLMVLGEILKDTYLSQNQKALPKNYFNTAPESTLPNKMLTKAKYELSLDKIALFSVLSRSNSLEFAKYVQSFKNSTQAKDLQLTAIGYPLQIQSEILYQFDMMNWLLQKIKIVSNGKREFVQSSIENSDLSTQNQKIIEKLSQFSNMLGVGEAEQSNDQLVHLNKEQREIAIVALKGLQNISNEMMLYGSMANAVSWDKIRNLKEASQKGEAFNSASAKKLQELSNILLHRH